MKFLKLYEEFITKDKKVNWGEPELEVKEMFRVFSSIDLGIDNIAVNGDVFNIDRTILKNDFEPIEFEKQVEDKNSKHTDPSKPGGITTEHLLKMNKFTVDGKKVDSKPYHEFIRFCKKIFWTGEKLQLDEAGVKKLADDSQSINRGDFANYLKDSNSNNKEKDAYDRIMEFLKSKGAENRFNTKGVFSDFPDINKEDWLNAIRYRSYLEDSFSFFDKQIESGSKMPLTSVIEIKGKWYIVGGNRRMSFYVLSGVNPVVWLIKM